MTKRKKILWLVLLLGLLAAALVLVMGVIREPEQALLKVLTDKIDLQVRDVRFTEVGDSGMNWEVTADTARYQKEAQLAHFENIRVKLVTKEGATYVLTGDRGTLKTDSRDLEVEGNVLIVSEKGDRFTTRSLKYRNADRVIRTDDPVQMESGLVRVSGVGMVLHLDENRVTLLAGVRASSGQ
jgi:LPS export ABC transporter protein LptC